MDMTTAIITICVSVIGSSAMATLIQFFVNRSDNKHDRLKGIEESLEKISKRLDENEMDGIRTQMLLMMSDYPDNVTEIMKLAERYFGELGGDWYMTSIFNKWLGHNKIAKPEWFDSTK